MNNKPKAFPRSVNEGTARWQNAADIATAEGLEPGKHEWWNRIREQLGIPVKFP